MVERAVKVSLSASMLSYKQGMQDAADATRKVGTEGEKLAQLREVYDGIGRGALVMGGLMATGIGIAIGRFAEFDAAMSNVKAATHESSENMGLLREAALEAGASTVFSATEAAGAIEELAKAGISTSDIMKGALTGSLDLAAAGELGVARAAEITSTALNQFGLDGSKASHVADVLAAGAGKAMGSVEDLANGLKFVGPVAASLGVSLEETTGVLALFAQQGIIGEQAGTSLRGVLSSLTAPSAQARTEIDKLGITLYDSNGKFLGLENAAGQLANAYTGMDDASRQASMGIIFGRETITAATALYQAGASGVDEWTKAVDDSGFAAETARMRLDNLNGDIEALGGALDSALIKTGSGANGVLRDMVQSLTGLAEMYGDLPDGVQGAVLAIGVGTAAMALAGGTALSVVPKFLEFKAAVNGAGFTLTGVAAKAAAAGLALGAVVFAISEVSRAQAEARARADAYATTLEEGTNKVTAATEEMVVANLSAKKQQWWWEQDSAFENARTLGVDLKTVKDATLGNVDALRRFDAETDLSNKNMYQRAEIANRLGIGLNDLDVATGQLRDSVRGESSSIEEAIRVNEEKAAVTNAATSAEQKASAAAAENANALAALAGEATDTAFDMDALTDTILNFGSAELNARDAARNFEAAIDALTDSVNQNGQTLDIGTAAGRANEAALDNIAEAALKSAAATLQQTGSQEQATKAIENGRGALINALGQLGITGQAAEDYANKLGLIPENIPTAVTLNTKQAQLDIDSYISRNTNKEIILRINNVPVAQGLGGSGGLVSENGNFVDYQRGMAKVKAFENGGFATGIYGAVPGGIHKFAEPATGWEAYISGKPSEKDRNIAIWEATGHRLGVGQPQPVTYVTNTIAPEIHAAPGMDETAIVNKTVRRVQELLR